MAKKQNPFMSIFLLLLLSAGSLIILSFGDIVYPKTASVSASAENTEHSLWVGEKKNVIGISINNAGRFSEIPANHLEDIAADAARGIIWVGTRKEILQYSFSGEEKSRYRVNIKNDCGERAVHISLSQPDGSLWVGAKDEIIKLSSEGGEIFRIRTEDHIVDVSAEGSEGTCWVGFKQKVTKYSPEGEPLFTLDVEKGNTVNALTADPRTHCLWIGTKKGLIKVDSDGVLSHIREPLDIQDLKTDLSDASVWVVTKKEVFKYSHEGQRLFRRVPCSKEDKDKYHKKDLHSRCNDPEHDKGRCEGNLLTLAVDPDGSTCWVALRKSLLKLGKDGEFLEWLHGFRQIEALDIGFSPAALSLRIESPLNGEVFSTTPVDVSGVLSDPEAAVSVNGHEAAVSENTFTTSGLVLQEGQNTITAVAVDGYGRTATDTITVTLITRGTITGRVTDSTTGLAIPGASVTIRDSLDLIHSTTTDDNGEYTVAGMNQGGFTAFFEKSGYATNTVTGALNAGETKTVDVRLTPLRPLTVKITSPSGGAVLSASPTDVGGTVSDPAAWVTVNGVEAIVSGDNFEARGVPLIPGANSITATVSDDYGRTASDTITVNYSQLRISITIPSEGNDVNKPEIMVTGTVITSSVIETGVVVNGIVATVTGNQFTANHVPLTDGLNTIAATATDIAGNTASTSITVNVVTAGNYIRITSNIESGIAPLEITLGIDGSFSIEASSISTSGPAQAEILESTADEYRIEFTEEGIYYITGSAASPDGSVYKDTIAITVLSRTKLDNLLKDKWEAMRTALANQDIESAIVHYSDETKQLHHDFFVALYDELPQIAQEMQQIELIYARSNTAKYRLRREELYGGQMVTMTYPVYFIVDRDGTWKIYRY